MTPNVQMVERMPETATTLVVVYFRTLTLDHLDAAWFSLSQMEPDFDVTAIRFLDNNTDDDPDAITAVLDRYAVPFPVEVEFAKHGDLRKTHSWSVNHALGQVETPWVFFTSADYLLDPTCLRRFLRVRDDRLAGNPAWQGLVTSWCHQMGCDARLSNTDVLAAHSQPDAPWREDGLATLVGAEPACLFHDSDKDAGVWLLPTAVWRASGGLDERLVSWGYQQSIWQSGLAKAGAEMVQIPEYLYHHQHHAAPRNVGVAAAEARRWRRR